MLAALVAAGGAVVAGALLMGPGDHGETGALGRLAQRLVAGDRAGADRGVADHDVGAARRLEHARELGDERVDVRLPLAQRALGILRAAARPDLGALGALDQAAVELEPAEPALVLVR